MVRRCLALTVALAAFAVTASPALAAQGGTTEPRGNSENATLCQKGGFETVVGSDGTAFQNAGKCASTAAQGGTLAPPTFEGTCAASPERGYYVDTGYGFDAPVCYQGNGVLLDSAAVASLEAACRAEGGFPYHYPPGSFGDSYYNFLFCYPSEDVITYWG